MAALTIDLFSDDDAKPHRRGREPGHRARTTDATGPQSAALRLEFASEDERKQMFVPPRLESANSANIFLRRLVSRRGARL